MTHLGGGELVYLIGYCDLDLNEPVGVVILRDHHARKECEYGHQQNGGHIGGICHLRRSWEPEGRRSIGYHLPCPSSPVSFLMSSTNDFKYLVLRSLDALQSFIPYEQAPLADTRCHDPQSRPRY